MDPFTVVLGLLCGTCSLMAILIFGIMFALAMVRRQRRQTVKLERGRTHAKDRLRSSIPPPPPGARTVRPRRPPVWQPPQAESTPEVPDAREAQQTEVHRRPEPGSPPVFGGLTLAQVLTNPPADERVLAPSEEDDTEHDQPQTYGTDEIGELNEDEWRTPPPPPPVPFDPHKSFRRKKS